MFWPDDWEFCRNFECRDRDLVFRLQDRFFIRQRLQGFGRNPLRMRAMRTLLSQEGPASRVSRMSDETVIDQIAHLLVSGRLHVHAQPWCGLPGSSGQSASTASSSAAASAAASAKDAEKLAPFPLSERGQREPAASVAPKPAEQSVICRLLSAKYTCEHGRSPQDGVLCVVPTSYASIGDKITCTSQLQGGCGKHTAWSIGGMWTSTATGTSTSFNAKTFKPAVTAWLRLHKVDPQTYTVGAEACQGSASSVEVRAYPPDKVEAKLDFTKLRKAIKDGLAVLPLSETDKEKFEPDFLNFSISCSEQWKEDQKSARAFCEGTVSGGADPLLKLEHSFPIYPLSIIPPGLEDYVKAGLYVTPSGELTFIVSWVGRYWSDTAKWQHDKFEITFSGKVEAKLSANLFLVSKDVINAELAGVTSFTGTAKGLIDDDPAIETELMWDGLEAVITVEAAWGFIEYKKEFPIFGERKLAGHVFHLVGSGDASSDE